MPLKHNNINGSVSSAKNTLAPQENISLRRDNRFAKYFSKLFKPSPIWG